MGKGVCAMRIEGNNPVFVTGVERSGSSIIAQIISLCGVFTGRTSPMYENIGIKNLLDSFFFQMKADPRGQYPLPDLQRLVVPLNWSKKVEGSLYKDGYDGKTTWMYKSNRIAQTWPLWSLSFPNAKWIIVRRRTGDVVDSCIKTGYMDAYQDRTIQQLIGVETERDGWLWWVHEHEKMFVGMLEEGLDCKVIWPERILTGDFRQIYEMLNWLGLKWNVGIMEVLEKKLIKNHKP